MASSSTCSETERQKECQVCQVTTGLLRCGACQSVWYCSKDHQKENWKNHKPNCVNYVVQLGPNPGQFDLGNPNHRNGVGDGFFVVPHESNVCWKFSRDLPAGTTVFTEEAAQLMLVFDYDLLKSDPSDGFRLPTKIVSKKFPCIQVDRPNCRLESVCTLNGETRLKDLEGKVVLKTLGPVKKGDIVQIDRDMGWPNTEWSFVIKEASARKLQLCIHFRLHKSPPFDFTSPQKNVCFICLSLLLMFNISFTIVHDGKILF